MKLSQLNLQSKVIASSEFMQQVKTVQSGTDAAKKLASKHELHRDECKAPTLEQ
jgi:hypothetical protein